MCDHEKGAAGVPIDDSAIVDALDTLEDLFFVLEEDGTVVHVNERGSSVLGHTPGSLTSADVTELFAPDHRDRVRASIEAALDTGFDERELDLLGADGRTRTYEFSTLALSDEPSTRLVGIGRDVSDRKERERALRRLHRTTRELMRAQSRGEIAETTTVALAEILSLPHAAIHLYREGEETLVPVAWTDRVESVIGTPPALGPGSIAWETFQRGELGEFQDLDEVDTLHNESTPLQSELVIPLEDNGVAIVASTEQSAFDATDCRLAQLLCENATVAFDRVGREELLRQREGELQHENERLEAFASVVSHDLRNPLNVASGRLELAAEECESEHIDGVEAALDRMNTLIDDVLTLARDGKTVETVEPVQLSTLVDRCWEAVETEDAEVDVVDDLTIRADESRLARVFENLFRNSVEHGSTESRAQPGDSEASETPRTAGDAGDSVEHGSTDDPQTTNDAERSAESADPVRVTVGALADDRGFYVEDDGVGIPASERERVFEAGYSTADDGTGFGLRIVRDIVEAHGWSIDVTSGTDGGARFEITGVERCSPDGS
jgi:PAS domain S-box-containing protein